MDIVNTSAFTFAPLGGRVRFPAHSLTLIVKGAFDLHPGRPATPAETQLFPTGDEYEADDEESAGSPRYATDFAYLKPRADLLLAGRCHVPGGRPRPACRVAFQVGSHARSLAVFGDRIWIPGSSPPAASDPVPFTEMALCYENSFGGAGYDANPVGKGITPEAAADGGTVHPLPNIEDPEALITSPDDRPVPAGFGPLSHLWAERYVKLGSYDGDYLEKRWPWFAEDFDWSHLNAAPAALQVEGYLKGDEALRFENLHPDHSVYESALPGLRPRCFLNRLDETGAERFAEVTLRLDTLWVDMEAERLVLVWRGGTHVASPDHDELRSVYLAVEPLAEEPAPLERHRADFARRLAERQAGRTPSAQSVAPAAVAGAEEAPAAEAAPAQPVNEEFRRTLEQVRPQFERAGIDLADLESGDPSAALGRLLDKLKADLRARGVDPDNPPELTSEQKRLQATMMAELGIPRNVGTGMPELNDPGGEVPPEATLAPALAKLKDQLKARGVDPHNPPDITPEQRLQLKSLGIDLDAFEATMAEAQTEEGAEAAWQPSREAVQERATRGESLAGLDLQGLDLSGLDLSGANLSGAILAGVTLKGADLSKADLRGANLAGADLQGAGLAGARLDGADLTGARLTEADLGGAVLDQAVAEQADLQGARLDEATAGGTYLAGAKLAQSRARGARLDGANLSGAELEGADLTGASLRGARLHGAKAAGIKLDDADLTGLRASDGADLTGGSFRRAEGAGSLWMESDLAGADFSWARMSRADFTAATLERARLHAADLRTARFLTAKLAGAQLTQANLFECSLERADLTGTDLRGSNLYGAEVLDATLAETRLEGANLSSTKLAREAQAQ